jgi:hypothetical protein
VEDNNFEGGTHGEEERSLKQELAATYLSSVMASLDATLALILSRLTAIEAAVAAGGGGGGGAGGGAAEADGLGRLANDFDLSVVKGKGAAALEAAGKLGAEGAAVVRARSAAAGAPCAKRGRGRAHARPLPRVPRAACARLRALALLRLTPPSGLLPRRSPRTGQGAGDAAGLRRALHRHGGQVQEAGGPGGLHGLGRGAAGRGQEGP